MAALTHTSRTDIQAHAIARLRERYGIEATQDDLNQIGAKLRSGEIVPVFRQGVLKANGTGGRAWLVVTHLHGQSVGLCYSPGRKCIVTAHPKTPDGGFSTSAGGSVYYPPDHHQHLAHPPA